VVHETIDGGVTPVVLEAARDRLNRAHVVLVEAVDLLPACEGDTRMASAEVDAALLDLRAAKRALQNLEQDLQLVPVA
jgi:hypothetical protein